MEPERPTPQATAREPRAQSSIGLSTTPGLETRQGPDLETTHPAVLSASQPTEVGTPAVPRRRSGRLPVVAEWVTAGAAIAALVLSVVTWRELKKEPATTVSLPKLVRLAEHSDGFTLTIQPTFTVLTRTDVTSVLSDVQLRVIPKNGVSPSFRWVDVAEFSMDTQTRVPVWSYLADPAAIVITQDAPYAKHLRFVSDESLPSGLWSMTLVAVREQQSSLERDFCVDLTSAAVKQMHESAGGDFILRNDRPVTVLGSLPRVPEDGCYRL